MLRHSKPTQNAITAFLSAQQNKSFSCAEVGSTRHDAPVGYTVDHHRSKLGQGVATFARAKHAITQWKMFAMPWINLYPPDTPIVPGATVAVVVSHFGFFSMNASRIVYVIDESGPIQKFGFAYGTLSAHAERGEERFTVEFHAADDTVWYDLYAFSRPRVLARVAYPFSRALQKRFARDSITAMRIAAQEI